MAQWDVERIGVVHVVGGRHPSGPVQGLEIPGGGVVGRGHTSVGVPDELGDVESTEDGSAGVRARASVVRWEPKVVDVDELDRDLVLECLGRGSAAELPDVGAQVDVPAAERR